VYLTDLDPSEINVAAQYTSEVDLVYFFPIAEHPRQQEQANASTPRIVPKLELWN